MWDTIRDLVASGSTVLLTTQYLDEADQLADRIAVIDRGRVVAEGTPDELKTSVGSSSLQLRVMDPRDTDATMEAIERILGVHGTLSPEASRITAPMAEPDRVTDLLLALRQSGIGLDEISVQKPTLDEVFLTLTGHDAADQNQPEAQNAEGEKEEVLA
jgi:ABC-2 type transport system ATP-binding protein